MKIIFEKHLYDEGRAIREEIFLVEQKFSTEFDDTDDTCWHLLITEDDGKGIAVARMFEGTQENEFILGRIAVRQSYRKQHYGNLVMEVLESKVKEMGGKLISLDAQCQAQIFYEKLGYTAFGDIHYDEHCPHISMEKKI
ncbi:MAG: GNAT family N-acetyltransferase [Clostridia bacterium]|nr:GNAT family N-acetyltransferase [Clostridia bacterium]